MQEIRDGWQPLWSDGAAPVLQRVRRDESAAAAVGARVPARSARTPAATARPDASLLSAALTPYRRRLLYRT